MAQEKGNRANVLARFVKGFTGRTNNPRKPFKGTPQFTFEELYITPFTHELTSDELGRTGYTPIAVNLTPTGIRVMDEYLQSLRANTVGIGDFCARYNAKTTDLDGLVFMLTGMSNVDFRNRWIVRTADDLLRYTDMEIGEVARLSGAGTRTNLYYAFERDMNCSPSARRAQARKHGDLGRFKIVR